MRSLILLGIVCLAGCSSNPSATTAKDTGPATPPGAAAPGQPGGIAPIGANVGGITPVVGGENMGETTGGGIAQAAKNRAKNAAEQQSQQHPTDEETTGQ